MRHLFILLLVLLSTVGHAQTTQYQGTVSSVFWVRGGLFADTAFRLPVRDTLAFTWPNNQYTTPAAKKGLMTVRPQDGLVYSHNGTKWGLLGGATSVSISDVTGLQAALDAKLTKSDLVIKEFPSGMINGANTTFSVQYAPASGSEELYWNGVLQYSGLGNSYTISGTTITTYFTPTTGDQLQITYIKQ